MAIRSFSYSRIASKATNKSSWGNSFNIFNILNIENPAKRKIQIIGLVAALLFTSACANLKRRDQIEKERKEAEQIPSQPIVVGPAEPPPVKIEVPPPKPVEPPKIGLVLGAGGLRTFAHVGVLQELEEAKIPVHAIVGLEWGSLPAAMYASELSGNDLEWQLSKIEESNVFGKTFLGQRSSETQPPDLFNDFLSKIFGDKSFQDLKIPTACPVLDLNKKSTIVVKSGELKKALKSCASYPPLYFPNERKLAAAGAVDEAISFLRSQESERIIFVNVIEAGEIFEPAYRDDKRFRDEVIWNELRSGYKNSSQRFDEVIGIYAKDISITDFAKRRELMRIGRDAGKKLVKRLTEKYGF